MTRTRYNFQTGQYEPLPDYLLNSPNYTGDWDDEMSAEDYDRRAAIRDGWASDTTGF
jgi:hypothetical protein